MKIPGSRTIVHAITLLLSLAVPALVQPAGAMEAAAGEQPEEIIVTGRQSLMQLQARIELEQDRMFGLFNDLNDDDRYDIFCFREQRTGTKISQRVCRPTFLRDSMALNAKAFIAGAQGSSAAIGPEPQSEINLHYPILRKKMNALAEQNPEFAASVAKHHELIEEFARRTSSAREE